MPFPFHSHSIPLERNFILLFEIFRLIYLLKVPDNLNSSILKILNWAKVIAVVAVVVVVIVCCIPQHAPGVSVVSRVRALQVLLAIAPPPLIQQVSKTSISDIRCVMCRANPKMGGTPLKSGHSDWVTKGGLIRCPCCCCCCLLFIVVVYCYCFRELLQSSLFVCELEGLKLSITIPAFQAYMKEGLVRTLWKNHSHKPKVRIV